MDPNYKGTIKQITQELYELLPVHNIPVIENDKIIKDKKNLIGEGSFGKVYAGKYGDIDVAIKKLKLTEDAVLNEIVQEMISCTKLSHPRIPKFYGVWRTDKYLHLIFDYIKGTNLQNWKQNNKNATHKEIVDIAIQIVEIMAGIHSQNVIHRDLKPENIMLMDGRIYIIDFGVSKISMHTITGTNVARGTPRYFGPENCCTNDDVEEKEDNKEELESKEIKQKLYQISNKYDIIFV